MRRRNNLALRQRNMPVTTISTASAAVRSWAMRVSSCFLSTLPIAASWVTFARGWVTFTMGTAFATAWSFTISTQSTWPRVPSSWPSQAQVLCNRNSFESCGFLPGQGDSEARALVDGQIVNDPIAKHYGARAGEVSLAPHDDECERALAASVGTQQGMNLLLGDGQIESVEDPFVVRRKRDVVNPHQVGHRAPASLKPASAPGGAETTRRLAALPPRARQALRTDGSRRERERAAFRP